MSKSIEEDESISRPVTEIENNMGLGNNSLIGTSRSGTFRCVTEEDEFNTPSKHI